VRLAVKKAWMALLLAVILAAGVMPSAYLAAQESAGVTITVSGRAALRIAFITPLRETPQHQVSAAIKIQIQDSLGHPFPLPAGDVTISLSVTSTTGKFLASASSTNPISSVVIPAGQSSATFYYVDSVVGNYNMTAAETPSLGWIDGRQAVHVIQSGGGGGGGGGSRGTPAPAPSPEPPAPPAKLLPVDVINKTEGVQVKSDGTVVSTATVTDTTKTASITIDAGTKITALVPPGTEGAGEGATAVPDRIEIIPSPDPSVPPPPQGYAMVSIPYEARAIINGIPTPVSFDRPVAFTFNWNEQKYAAATDIIVAYYSKDRGWISTEPPPGFVAEVGKAAGQTTHFTLFAVFGRIAPAPSPARFDVRNLTTFPKEVKSGESVTISATITNIGGMRGEYVVRLNVPGLLETFQAINLAPRETQQVRFTIVPNADGTYPVELGDVGNFFTVTALPTTPPVRVFTFYWWVYLIMAALTAAVFIGIIYGIIVPTRRRRRVTTVIRRAGREKENLLLKVSKLTITPPRADQGAAVTVVADVTNVGETACAYSLVLKVGGMVEALKEVILEPNQTEKVAFTLMKDAPGDYEVDLEGLKGQFSVMALSAPPAPAPAP